MKRLIPFLMLISCHQSLPPKPPVPTCALVCERMNRFGCIAVTVQECKDVCRTPLNEVGFDMDAGAVVAATSKAELIKAGVTCPESATPSSIKLQEMIQSQ